MPLAPESCVTAAEDRFCPEAEPPNPARCTSEAAGFELRPVETYFKAW